MELTNRERVCFGLNEVKDTWLKKQISAHYWIYIDGNYLVKRVQSSENVYYESDVYYKLSDDYAFIFSKTDNGKPKKMSETNIKNLAQGVYLSYYDGKILIGNGNCEQTYYDSLLSGVEVNSVNEFRVWVDNWVLNTTETDLLEVEEFKNSKLKRYKFKKGDYFRVRLNRNLYSYGRILMDIYKEKKSGLKYWDVLMGKPVIVEMFHILTDDKNVSIDKLEKLRTFPSQHILDNVFTYGDYEIIGNDNLSERIAYPIMYGKNIDMSDSNKICFQSGEIYKEISYDEVLLIGGRDENGKILNKYINNGIGYDISVNADIIKRCVLENSNDYYWEYYKVGKNGDLRNPENRSDLISVLEQFDLMELLDLYK